MRILLGQVLPSCPAPQNPQNAIQHATVLDPRAATLAVLARFGKQGSDFLPLHFRQQRTRSGHRPSFGAAEIAYLSSEKTQLPSFQEPVLGYATASRHSAAQTRCGVHGSIVFRTTNVLRPRANHSRASDAYWQLPKEPKKGTGGPSRQ